MKFALRFVIFVVILMVATLSAVTVSANTSTLKCNPQKDAVWIYDSLATLDVQAKLSCGETVEVLERTKDYVKIRTRSGVEGYVPETAFSDLPAYEIRKDPTHDVGYAAKNVQAKEIAKVAASNSAFVNPGVKPPDSSVKDSSLQGASAQVSKSEAANGASRNKPAHGASILPNTELAEMSPRNAPARVEQPSVIVAAKEPVAEPTTLSSKSLDAAAAAAPKPVSLPAVATVSPASSEDADSDAPEYKLESDSQNLSCRNYFSAYGLTAGQLKWIARNRQKMFPSVCPAPDVSKVNYVIIFTHDVGFFSVTMPDPVHSNAGFSDFRPITPVDNTLVSESDSDKAHREYVWVFQFAHGGFDPETFSPHRAFQFSKVETNSFGSNAGQRAIEDAFHFLESANR